MPRARIGAALAAMLAGLGAGCGDSSECERRFVGDQGAQVELEMVSVRDGALVPVVDDSDVDLIVPPQGGLIVLAGARARNLSAGPIELSAWLLDEESGDVFGLESRPAELAEAEDGWAQPVRPDSLASLSNIAACPSSGLPRDLYDQPWTLVVRVTDCADRSGEAAVRVTPRCAPPTEDTCRCICDEDYRLGDVCSAADAGP